MSCKHENKNIATAMQCMDCGEYFNALHEHQLENTGIGDGRGYTFKEGDIVEFNLVGSEFNYQGKVVAKDGGWKIQVPKDGYEIPKRYYDLNDDVFGRAKLIKNI